MSRPVAIATWQFGAPAAELAYRQMLAGASSLDAVEAGINLTERDVNVTSVGYGGLPNADGELEVDAAIMDGPGHRAGSVAALRQIRAPISVARRIMDECPHVMLVGEGALQWALEHGFERESTRLDSTRELYQDWVKRGRPGRWLGGAGLDVPPPEKSNGAERDSHDTIGLAALDSEGRLAVGCSTSGLAFKVPGRVGDSPIIGAGLYVDQKAGAASATGVGELILRFSLSHLVVERMRAGSSPQKACNEAILRLLEADSRYATMQVGVIALNGDGEVGAASTRPAQHALTYAIAGAGGVEVVAAEIPV